MSDDKVVDISSGKQLDVEEEAMLAEQAKREAYIAEIKEIEDKLVGKTAGDVLDLPHEELIKLLFHNVQHMSNFIEFLMNKTQSSPEEFSQYINTRNM